MPSQFTLDDYVERNYDRLKDSECLPMMLAYLDQTESVLDEDIIFVKQLTKVGRLICKQSPERLTDDHLRKLFQFNLDGLRLIREHADDEEQKRYAIIDAHLLADAANIADLLYKRTGDLMWGEQAYDFSLACADQSIEREPEHARVGYETAAVYAQILFMRDRNPVWLERKYDARLHLVELQVGIEQGYVAQRAGKTALDLAYVTRHRSWLKKAQTHFLFSIDLFEQAGEVAEVAWGHSHLAQSYFKAFNLQNRESSLAKAYRHYKLAAQLYDSLDDGKKKDEAWSRCRDVAHAGLRFNRKKWLSRLQQAGQKG